MLLADTGAIPASSVLAYGKFYRLLGEQGHRSFRDETFADLFQDVGRRSVPPRVVATVMVLHRIEGVSEREAVDRFAFDLRWKYAAGVDLDYPAFVHTVLLDMRERPNRIFEAALEMAKGAGLAGRKRVLDPTALYDAVATQDTVAMVRSAIRGLLGVADESLGTELRATLERDDDCANAGEPLCDWDNKAAREALVDGLARDGYALLAQQLDGRELSAPVQQAAALLATVLGQDIESGDDVVFRIARRVAIDRVISTVDPEARHGHKTASRGFDGYKGHIGEMVGVFRSKPSEVDGERPEPTRRRRGRPTSVSRRVRPKDTGLLGQPSVARIKMSKSLTTRMRMARLERAVARRAALSSLATVNRRLL